MSSYGIEWEYLYNRPLEDICLDGLLHNGSIRYNLDGKEFNELVNSGELVKWRISNFRRAIDKKRANKLATNLDTDKIITEILEQIENTAKKGLFYTEYFIKGINVNHESFQEIKKLLRNLDFEIYYFSDSDYMRIRWD